MPLDGSQVEGDRPIAGQWVERWMLDRCGASVGYVIRFKAATTRPAASSLGAQQRRFNGFREEFNHERPHEALDQQTPATCYHPSPRPMPDRLPPLEYPDRFEVRYVSANGGIRWNRRWVNVSTVCVGEYVGLEEIDDGIWNVYFGPLRLGRLLERHMRIEDAYGRLRSRYV